MSTVSCSYQNRDHRCPSKRGFVPERFRIAERAQEENHAVVREQETRHAEGKRNSRDVNPRVQLDRHMYVVADASLILTLTTF